MFTSNNSDLYWVKRRKSEQERRGVQKYKEMGGENRYKRDSGGNRDRQISRETEKFLVKGFHSKISYKLLPLI